MRGAIYASAPAAAAACAARLPGRHDGSPRSYVLFDVDGPELPIGFVPLNQVVEEEGPPDDPASSIPWEEAVHEFSNLALPAEFGDSLLPPRASSPVYTYVSRSTSTNDE